MMVRRPAARVPSALGALALSVGIFLYAFASPPTAASSTETVQIRGHSQTLHTYGSRGGEPVIVSSGDGGWVHLGPHIAQTLAGAWVLRGGLRRQELPAGFHLNPSDAAPGGRSSRLLRAAGIRQPGRVRQTGIDWRLRGRGSLDSRCGRQAGPTSPQPASSASVCQSRTSSDGDGATR